MKIDLELNDKQKQYIQSKFEEFASDIMTDEYLDTQFKELLKGNVQACVNEYLQSSKFKDMIRNRIYPKVVDVFGKELMLEELDR